MLDYLKVTTPAHELARRRFRRAMRRYLRRAVQERYAYMVRMLRDLKTGQTWIGLKTLRFITEGRRRRGERRQAFLLARGADALERLEKDLATADAASKERTCGHCNRDPEAVYYVENPVFGVIRVTGHGFACPNGYKFRVP